MNITPSEITSKTLNIKNRAARIINASFPKSVWDAKSTVILQRGEFGVESDTLRIKLGNGFNTWEELTYIAQIEPRLGITTETINPLVGQTTTINIANVQPSDLFIGELIVDPNGSFGSIVAVDGNNTLTVVSTNKLTQANWTQINSGSPDYIRNKPDLTIYATNTRLDDEITRSTNQDTVHTNDINARIQNTILPTAMTDLTVDPNLTSTVILKKQTKDTTTGTPTNTNINLPVATNTTAGVANPATIQAIETLQSQIQTLDRMSFSTLGLPLEPTQLQLTTAWQTASGMLVVDILDGQTASLADLTNALIYTYYGDSDIWFLNGTIAEEISLFTNTTPGVIKGSTLAGQVYAEANGTGSLVGYDTIKTDIATNTSNIALNTTAISLKQDQLTAGTNINITNNVISATPSSTSTNISEAAYFNTGNTLTLTEPTTTVNIPFVLVNNVATAQNITLAVANQTIISASSLYDANIFLTGLATNRLYTITGTWKYGATVISTGSFPNFNPSASTNVINIPMNTNLLTSELTVPAAGVLTLTLTIAKDGPAGTSTINLLSSPTQTSSFIRNGGNITANNVFDVFDGNLTSQSAINQILNNKPSGGSPIGSYIISGSQTPQTGMVIAGTDVSRTTYDQLFALFGTRYGVGDGSTTFGTPSPADLHDPVIESSAPGANPWYRKYKSGWVEQGGTHPKVIATGTTFDTANITLPVIMLNTDYKPTIAGAKLNTGANGSSIRAYPNTTSVLNIEFYNVAATPIHWQVKGYAATAPTSKVYYYIVASGQTDAPDQLLATNVINQVNANTNNISNMSVRYPIEVSTIADSPNWWVKYNDGWIEQGGYNNGLNNTGTNTLPIAMANNNYSILVSRFVVGVADDNAAISLQARNVTTTNFQVRQTYSSNLSFGLGAGAGYAYKWEVKGWAA